MGEQSANGIRTESKAHGFHLVLDAVRHGETTRATMSAKVTGILNTHIAKEIPESARPTLSALSDMIAQDGKYGGPSLRDLETACADYCGDREMPTAELLVSLFGDPEENGFREAKPNTIRHLAEAVRKLAMAENALVRWISGGIDHILEVNRVMSGGLLKDNEIADLENMRLAVAQKSTPIAELVKYRGNLKRLKSVMH